VVAHSRTPARPHRLRPLREPRPIAVEADGEGRPVAVRLRPDGRPSGRGERLRVAEVQDVWRIDDEWWRQRPVSRLYWRLTLEDGQVVTVYEDLVSGRWAIQSY
jgi:hypothetical protein